MRLELTRRADYAVRAAIALARRDGDGRLSVTRIAAEQRIPPRFLPQVMGDLVRAGIADAATGRNGGYRLRRAAETVTLLEVIEAVEGDARRRTCVLRGGPCGWAGVCDVHAVFEEAQERLLARLAEADLSSVAASR